MSASHLPAPSPPTPCFRGPVLSAASTRPPTQQHACDCVAHCVLVHVVAPREDAVAVAREAEAVVQPAQQPGRGDRAARGGGQAVRDGEKGRGRGWGCEGSAAGACAGDARPASQPQGGCGVVRGKAGRAGQGGPCRGVCVCVLRPPPLPPLVAWTASLQQAGRHQAQLGVGVHAREGTGGCWCACTAKRLPWSCMRPCPPAHCTTPPDLSVTSASSHATGPSGRAFCTYTTPPLGSVSNT